VNEIRDDLEATIAARREVGAELEPQLVDRFVERVEQEIERRASERAAGLQPRRSREIPVAVPLGSLGIAIPLLGIAGGTAHLAGVIAVCIAIVLVNLVYFANNRL